MNEIRLLKGNEALAEGALRAGCRFFAGYPITPQNEIPEYMARHMAKIGGSFVQAESEVSAINMVFGASACGVRAMTSSSSPGISLKQEGLSYMAGAELPMFYVNIVRGGPGLGNIAPAQSDYHISTRGGGHGDYRTIVFAPASVSEMANFPKICFELAEKYRIPTMVLADGILGQMMEPASFDFEPINPKNLPEPDFALGCHTGRTRRIVSSTRLAPGQLEAFNRKLVAKHELIEKSEVRFESSHSDDADLVIVAFGTSARIAKAALHQARKEGLKIGLFRPITLWPFPSKELLALANQAKKFLVVEMNLGQMLDDVKIAVEGKAPVCFYGMGGGWIPTPEGILSVIKKELKP